MAVSAFALIGFNSFHAEIKGISDKGIPDITKRAKLNNLISQVLSETERLISAQSTPVQRLSYGSIQKSIEEINQIVSSDSELQNGLSGEIETITSTLEELNGLVSDSVKLAEDKNSMVLRLFSFSEDIIRFEQEARADVGTRSGYNNLSAWIGHVIAIINETNKAVSIGAMYKVKILRESLHQDFDNLAKISDHIPSETAKDLKIIEQKLSNLVIGEDGLVNKIESAITVNLKKFGRGNFTRNMIDDFKGRNISGFNTLVATTAESSMILSKRIGFVTAVFTIISIAALLISAVVVVYFRRNIVQRLVKLNSDILSRSSGQDVEITCTGNDEISDMAEVFIFYDNEVSRREEELTRIAMVDSLTGVSNRRHFMELADRELQRSIRYDHPMCMLMLDIDHFKNVNDTYGHHVGDIVLQSISKVCRNTLRDNDLFGRLGGEEFAAVLVESDFSEAKHVAERLRELVESCRVDSEGELIKCTVSIGIACAGSVDSLEMLMIEADRALYKAKEDGRNRVVVADSQRED